MIEDTLTGSLSAIDPRKPLSRTERLILSYKFFVKDFFSHDSSHIYQLSIKSSQEDNFFPDDMTPKMYLRDENVRAEVEGCIKVLQCKNIWVEAIVKMGQQGLLEVVETQVNEY